MSRTFLILSLLLMPLLFPMASSAHFLGYSSVDDGEIRWEGSTKYGTARVHAIAQWNGVGPIDILPDSFWTYADVKFRDRYCSDCTWAGLYSNEWGTDPITFNTYYMDRFTDAQQKNVVLHELGHALGLAHSYYGQVMNPYVTSVTSPQSHDRADYHALWGW